MSASFFVNYKPCANRQKGEKEGGKKKKAYCHALGVDSSYALVTSFPPYERKGKERKKGKKACLLAL